MYICHCLCATLLYTAVGNGGACRSEWQRCVISGNWLHECCICYDYVYVMYTCYNLTAMQPCRRRWSWRTHQKVSFFPTDSRKFPTEEIIGAHNFNFATKFPQPKKLSAPNFVFWKYRKFPTRRKCTDKLKFRGREDYSPLPPVPPATTRVCSAVYSIMTKSSHAVVYQWSIDEMPVEALKSVGARPTTSHYLAASRSIILHFALSICCTAPP